MPRPHLTRLQRTNRDGFPKPGELIEIAGAHELEAPDRAILNLLYQHAHDSGRLTDRDAEWVLPLGELRRALSKHQSNDAVRASLAQLMKVRVKVSYTSAECPVCGQEQKPGDPRTLTTHLLDYIDTSDENDGKATVKFGLPKMLVPILAESNHWGRIKAEIVCAMSSKYAISLYEMVQLRANMDRCIETFLLARFRDLLGVPPGAYERGNDFVRFVIQPATLEVNGLSDMGVSTSLVRRNKITPIEAVTVAWWKKQGDEFRTAMQERNRSKVGRMARLRGKVENVTGQACGSMPGA
jgi:hypothetical protein